PATKKLTDTKLKAKTKEFKDRIEKGESLDNLLPEAFAVVREAARRTLKQRHFDVQLMGGIVLHRGDIAEMRTGEGKTLVATLPVYLNALEGKGVHLVTVNDYLAQRDAGWMGEIYHFLGMSVSVIANGNNALLYDPEFDNENHDDVRLQHLKPIDKKSAYRADITYGTNNEFGFDYLRDNMVQSVEQISQRPLHYAIVDEVDSILIDEARTPLIISAPATEGTSTYMEFAKVARQLKRENDFLVDEKANAVNLTDDGVNKIEKLLGIDNLYGPDQIQNIYHLEQALKAQALFNRDKNYVVKDGEVIIVDEFTGRLMPGRRYSEGLHQAIEAKEGVVVQQESMTLATISFQNFFRLYNKLAGMTGTAETEAEEFHSIYGLDVAVIPTNMPNQREDKPDRIYKTEAGKVRAIAQEIKKLQKKGQPVLIGTASIEKNEFLSIALREAGVEHDVLNAKNNEREAAIVAEAGQKGSVTLATNIAGRGTDIVLGEGVVKLGGLHVLGSERHESRRIDNQLRGRAGRQGDPGSTQFYVSLEDELMRVFGGDRISGLMNTLKIDEETPIENGMVSKALESAQKRVESHHYDIRKQVLQYDDVMNRHRATIYGRRRQILKGQTKDQIKELLQREINDVITSHTDENLGDIKREEVIKTVETFLPVDKEDKENLEKIADKSLSDA
ncbi:MAG: preprotein translocase subunit SecA, partial [Candidatus Saccharimonadales bacterium]